ncbi:MAG: T9SS type A sorting domain-containing protein [Bacteroidota bacterium]
MRKILLLFAFAFGIGFTFTQAQCTPNSILVSLGIPGIYPNPVQQSNLQAGDAGVPYSETITIIVLGDTMIDLSAIIGFPVPPVTAGISYQRVNSVDGLPNGLTWACNPMSCEVLGDSSGCVGITGTPTQSGTFSVSLDTEIGIDVPAGVPVVGGTTVDIPVPGVSWDLDISGVGIEELKDDAFTVAQNGPNPFHGTTTIYFNAPKPATISFVVTDISGRELHSAEYKAKVGQNAIEFNAGDMTPGIYLYRLSNGDKSVTKKMVLY